MANGEAVEALLNALARGVEAVRAAVGEPPVHPAHWQVVADGVRERRVALEPALLLVRALEAHPHALQQACDALLARCMGQWLVDAAARGPEHAARAAQDAMTRLGQHSTLARLPDMRARHAWLGSLCAAWREAVAATAPGAEREAVDAAVTAAQVTALQLALAGR